MLSPKWFTALAALARVAAARDVFVHYMVSDHVRKQRNFVRENRECSAANHGIYARPKL